MMTYVVAVICVIGLACGLLAAISFSVNVFKRNMHSAWPSS